MNLADYGIIGLGLLMGLVLFAFIAYDVWGQEPNYIDIQYEDYEWVIICQLLNREPFWDCPESVDGYFDMSGEEWMIFQLPVERFQDPTNETVLGYAVYSDEEGKSLSPADPLSLCNFFPKFNQSERICSMNYLVYGEKSLDTCYSPYPCTTVLEHELKHLKCKCDWHKGLESEPMVIVI